MARNAESSERGRNSEADSLACRFSANSALTEATAAAACSGPLAFTVTIRSLGPAWIPSSVASPACRSKAWFAGVPMNSATSRTPGSLRTCAEIRISTTESW